MSARQARGKAIVNLVNLSKDEKIADIISVKEFEADRYVVMATRNGIVKKTALAEYSNPRSAGIIAIHIPDDDELIGCKLTDGSYDVLLATHRGKAIRFSEKDVRDMGRTRARGHRNPARRGRPRRRDVDVQGGGRTFPHHHGERASASGPRSTNTRARDAAAWV